MTQVALFTEKKIFEFLSPKKDDIIRLMGGELAYKKEISFAIQAANSNSQLQRATPESVCKAIYNLSITGLSLNPVLKLAYLTPRSNGNGEIEAQLMPSYQGLVKLLADCNCVKQVYAHCRYEGDTWQYLLGTEISIMHSPEFKSKEILGVYAIAVLPNGEKIIEYMPTEEVHGIRARSDGYRAFKSGKIKSTPWVTDEQEMFRKTAIRRIFKYVPKTSFYNKVAEAIALDEVDYPATIGQESYIYSLLSSSSFDAEKVAVINSRMESGELTSLEAESIISELKDNQLDPTTQGPNHSLTEAKDAAKR